MKRSFSCMLIVVLFLIGCGKTTETNQENTQTEEVKQDVVSDIPAFTPSDIMTPEFSITDLSDEIGFVTLSARYVNTFSGWTDVLFELQSTSNKSFSMQYALSLVDKSGNTVATSTDCEEVVFAGAGRTIYSKFSTSEFDYNSVAKDCTPVVEVISTEELTNVIPYEDKLSLGLVKEPTEFDHKSFDVWNFKPANHGDEYNIDIHMVGVYPNSLDGLIDVSSEVRRYRGDTEYLKEFANWFDDNLVECYYWVDAYTK